MENILKDLINETFRETKSNFSKNIIENFENELAKFYQVCPKEMLDKLHNPISEKKLQNSSLAKVFYKNF